MLRIDILKEIENTNETLNTNKELVLIGINTDLNAIEQDLKRLKQIYKNIDKYKDKTYIKYFEADKNHLKLCIDYYKKTNFMYVNQKLVYITKKHINKSETCIMYLNKIIKELKKLEGN